MFGIIKKGKGGKPYDFLIFIPIIVSILSDIFLKNYFLPYKIPFVKMILIIIIPGCQNIMQHKKKEDL
jgi:hypothetical protein